MHLIIKVVISKYKSIRYLFLYFSPTIYWALSTCRRSTRWRPYRKNLEIKRLPKIVRKQKDWGELVWHGQGKGWLTSILDEGKGLCYVPKGTIVNLIPIIKRISFIKFLGTKKIQEWKRKHVKVFLQGKFKLLYFPLNFCTVGYANLLPYKGKKYIYFKWKLCFKSFYV